MSESNSQPLACPRCAARYSLEERFCTQCGVPLTYSGKVDAEEPADEQRRHARKIRPQYSSGELRRVTIARQQAEAEFVQMLLLEEGIPSTLRRTRGFDVPDFLAAGPRDVLVPESGVEVARQVLLESDIVSEEEGGKGASSGPSPRALLIGVLVAVAVVAAVAWALLGATT